MPNLSLSIVEIIVLMLGAIMLGITIHFFITSRRNLKNIPLEPGKHQKNIDEWKLRYFNDIEARDKEIETLRSKLSVIEESSHIYSIESEEIKFQNKKMKAELETLRKAAGNTSEKPDYITQLREAQSSLMAHNEKINQLLGQIDLVKENEEKQREIMSENEELSGQVHDLQQQLSLKEKEIGHIQQKETLTKEMNALLDNAYGEFNMLQDKIRKLETQVNTSRMISIEYEDLKEGHYTLSRDFEDQKVKYNTILNENRRLESEISEMDHKLREANMQRQQLQKRVAYLEELNLDLQYVSDANKKLEGQLKRIGELESMLNVVSEERDELVRKQANA